MTSQLCDQIDAPISELLTRFAQARVAVLGDICLDAYWHLEERAEKSLETGLPVQHVERQVYSPGGAGNVAANLAALGVGKVSVLGIVGQDFFGGKLLSLLTARGIDIRGVLTENGTWQTYVYAKPILRGRELSRLDFGGFNAPSEAAVGRIVALLEKAASSHDVLIVNQQIQDGIYRCDAVLEAINRIGAGHPHLKILVDSRHYGARFKHVILKANIEEAARLARC
jgi:bifunctional ADP-heptose synthase (sugar kinase/adenylyltransferase)